MDENPSVSSDPTRTTDEGRTRTASEPRRTPSERYELGEEIARGGMGIVYRAIDTTFERPVAVKVLLGGAARRFAEEARITGQLQHPAIPPVHDLGTLPDGRPFLAMKLIKGETLERLIKDRTDLETDRGRLVAAFEHVCQAVAYAHAHRVIHRDLKPANIMVGAFGEVQVMDWGLAKVLGEEPACDADPEATTAATLVRSTRDSDDDRTQAGSVLGTPAFMPPEQALGAVRKVDTRSDVFGLGGILAAILTGQPPFASSSVETTRMKAAQGKVEECFARLDASGADPELVALCKRCLSPTPADRPGDAGEVARAVENLRQAADERAKQAELGRVRSEEQRKRRKVQRTLGVVAVCLIAAAVFGATVAALWQRAERAKESAQTAQAEAEAAREQLAAVEYGRTMQVAYREWLDNNAGATVALLASTRPDLRGWEYHYLHGLCNTHLVTLAGHTKEIYSAEFSPDGSRVVLSGREDRKSPAGTAWVCDANTGAELLALQFPPGVSGEASFSSDGSRIFVAGMNKAILVWDAKTGAELPNRLFDTGGGRSTEVVHTWINPDGTRFVTMSHDGQFRVWDAKTGAELVTLEGTKRGESKHDWFGFASSRSMGFSPDGSKFAVVSPETNRESSVWVWDTRTGTKLLVFEGNADRALKDFSPDGSRLLIASHRVGMVRVLDAKSGAEQLVLEGHTRHVNSARFSLDGSRIVTGGFDGTARIWDAKTGNEVLVLKGHSGEVVSASFSSDGSRIVTASGDGTARVWDARIGAEVPLLKGHPNEVLSASFSSDGSRVVTVSNDGTIRVWNTLNGAKVVARAAEKDKRGVNWFRTAFSPDGTRVVTGDEKGKIQVWDVNTGTELLTLRKEPEGRGNQYRVTFFAFSPDGSRIVIANLFDIRTKPKDRVSNNAQVLDAKTGAELHSFLGPPFVSSLSFSLDGSRLVTASTDGSVGVWDARMGAELLTIQLAGFPTIAKFNPDGSRIVTGELDGITRVWDSKTGDEVLVLKGHSGEVVSASFSPNGSRVITGGFDGTARIWDARTGVEVMTLKGHTRQVISASFSPDGAWIVTASADGTARLWGVRTRKRP